MKGGQGPRTKNSLKVTQGYEQEPPNRKFLLKGQVPPLPSLGGRPLIKEFFLTLVTRKDTMVLIEVCNYRDIWFDFALKSGSKAKKKKSFQNYFGYFSTNAQI